MKFLNFFVSQKFKEYKSLQLVGTTSQVIRCLLKYISKNYTSGVIRILKVFMTSPIFFLNYKHEFIRISAFADNLPLKG